MKKKKAKINLIKFIFTAGLTIGLAFFILDFKDLLKLPTNTFIVDNGSLSYEESAIGYVIREEEVLRGEEYKNGMVQIKLEGERVAKGENVFRYYSNGEEELTKKIEDLNLQINEALTNKENSILNSDIINLDKQIEKNINLIYQENEIEKIKEYKKQIENYLNKKSQIAGEQSPAGSYIKQLINDRNALQSTLEKNAVNIVSNSSGIVSYRIDGLESVLTVNNGFDYLKKELLEGFGLKAGAIIPQSVEEGKVINNFYCYIATIIDSDNAMEAKEGNVVKIRFSNANQVSASIYKIIEEDGNRIIVFKIEDGVENLIEYRKISFDIIWWEYNGLKVSNDAIIQKEDLNYVERKKTNYVDNVLIKILRQNDTYSIVTNYTEEELKKMGYSVEEIENMKQIKVYDEILLH